MATNYSYGARFERAVLALAEGAGYKAVRSAQSKGAADLVLLRKGERPVAVQCKASRSGRNLVGRDEWNAFWAWCADAGAVPVIAEHGPRGDMVRLYRVTGERAERQRTAGLKRRVFLSGDPLEEV